MVTARDAALRHRVTYGGGQIVFDPPPSALNEFDLTFEDALDAAGRGGVEFRREGKIAEVWAALFTDSTPGPDYPLPVWVLRWTDVQVVPSKGGPRPGHVLAVFDAKNGSQLRQIQAGRPD